MYFYVDESGHTGPNLFDSAQPVLYYGVLASPYDVDLLGSERLRSVRERLGVPRLHAAELGGGGIADIGEDLVQLQRELDLSFDLICVDKMDHAVLSFFDQVFDQGLNPAVTWTGYWTPIRYFLLFNLAMLFDQDLAKSAWQARLEPNDAKSHSTLVDVCSRLRSRITSRLRDARSRQLIGDALEWAQSNPGDILYNAKAKKDRLAIMPNVTGFQSVMLRMANKLRGLQKFASRVVVDQQSQFNSAQKSLAELYATLQPLSFMPSLPEADFKNLLTAPLKFSSGGPGLELTDVFLWCLKRFREGKEVPRETFRFIDIESVEVTEISLKALEGYWADWLMNLPEPTSEEMAKARKLLEMDEERRIRGMEASIAKVDSSFSSD